MKYLIRCNLKNICRRFQRNCLTLSATESSSTNKPTNNLPTQEDFHFLKMF